MILYLDTTSNHLYTGIVLENELLCEEKIKLDKELSVFALTKIKDMFLNNKIDPINIDKIMIVNGPGSFTGIRIGLTIAKVWASSLKKELIPVSSIEAMSVSCNIDSYKVPIIDARRGYVFAGVYDELNKEILKPKYIELEILLDKLKEMDKDYVFVSNDEFDINDMIFKYNPDILKIVDTFKTRRSVDSNILLPNYLKLTEAEENLIKEENND
ncbi:MAG: tRNA (adenosine(37)-N6)-threonylcarbamoyltransferase complex dimerization subunit type 1 TsaB [Bacilli bacterium]